MTASCLTNEQNQLGENIFFEIRKQLLADLSRDLLT